jgi:ABC-type amino acid transport substrate-binding protein
MMMLLAACSGGNAPAGQGGEAPAQNAAEAAENGPDARGEAETARGGGEAAPSAGGESAPAEEEPAPEDAGEPASGGEEAAESAETGEAVTVTVTSGDLEPLEETPAVPVEEEPVVASGSDLLELGATAGSDLDGAQKRGLLRVGVAEGALTNGVWSCFEGAVAASFAASIALNLTAAEGDASALLEQLGAGELDCLWLSPAPGEGLELSAPLIVAGEESRAAFRSGSELRPLFDAFLAAAAEQGALDAIAEYYGVTAELGE